MPIISHIARKQPSQRFAIWATYGVLSLFGATMVIPFLITLSASFSNAFDHDRYSILPTALFSKEDRFVKSLVPFFNSFRRFDVQMRTYFPDMPVGWNSWSEVGDSEQEVERFAQTFLDADAVTKAAWARQASDYSDFSQTYSLLDSQPTFTREQGARIIADFYEAQVRSGVLPEGADPDSQSMRELALQLMSEHWGLPVDDFYIINFEQELMQPMDQQTWYLKVSPKNEDYLRIKAALRGGLYTPGVPGAWRDFLKEQDIPHEDIAELPITEASPAHIRSAWLRFSREFAPASPVTPFPLRMEWYSFLESQTSKEYLQAAEFDFFDIAVYNRLVGSDYAKLRETPFPLPEASAFDPLREAWHAFIQRRYPLRLVELQPTAETESHFQQFVLEKVGSLELLRTLTGLELEDLSDLRLPRTLREAIETGGLEQLWLAFVQDLPLELKQLNSSEIAWQDLVRERYGSLDDLNASYGTEFRYWEESFPPFAPAFYQIFDRYETQLAISPIFDNYSTVIGYLLNKGRALPVTIWLIVLTILASLTINPLAGYALSRFNPKGTKYILLWFLAVAAFPAAVQMIPGYLLLRDLGLLNTFWALVLPGAANGMSIFLLKGFFDALPKEYFEAATIDGAREWQIFFFVSMPMIKPILAVTALNAFIQTYNGWEWALIICQDQSMWTIAVWLYQVNQIWQTTPWISTAGFVVASVPTLIVFLFAQRIIMRGIAIPSLK